MVDYRLLEALNKVCLVVGVFVGTPGDSSTVRVDFGDGIPMAKRKMCFDVVDAFDWSAGAQATWVAGRSSLSAVTFVAGSNDPAFTADRVILRYLCTELNNVREKILLPRKTEAEIIVGLVAAAQNGAGAPASLS